MQQLRDELADVAWVYKPHPSLRYSVERNRVMDQEEYARYEASWQDAANATVYDSGDYFGLFRASDALVTCCGSFLAEYLPTGRPILWLVSERTVGLNRVGEELAAGFYPVRTPDELRDTLRRVVLEGDDPLAEVRQRLARQLFPAGASASTAVANVLRSRLLP